MTWCASFNEEGNAFIFTSQIGKLRHKETKELPEGHTATTHQYEILNLCRDTLEFPHLPLPPLSMSCPCGHTTTKKTPRSIYTKRLIV